MPQLRSQQDITNWTTPHINEIFTEDTFIGLADTRLTEIQQTLAAVLSTITPIARFTHRRSMPHYIQFQIDAHSKADNIRQQLINKLADKTDWIVGVLPHPEKNTTFDILLRTADHLPITLQHALMRSAYRKADSSRSVILGVALDQQIIIRSLENLQNLIIAGDESTTQNLVRSLLATLLMTNTPANLRLAFMGDKRSIYSNLPDTPHLLGEFVSNPAQGIRLLSGITREIRRRQGHIKRANSKSILDYNAEYPQATLPHVLLVIDSLANPAWRNQQGRWLTNLTRILRDGSAVGIHLFLIVPDVSNELLHPLYAVISTKVITSSLAKDYARQIDNFDPSLWQFVDAAIIEEGVIKPVEIPFTTASDTQAIAAHWRKNAAERVQINRPHPLQKSGITSLFQKLQREDDAPAPPVPQTPPAQVLAHAANVLSHIGDSASPSMQTHNGSVKITETQLEVSKPIVTPISGVSEQISIRMESIRRAHALASYLGWLGRGPLMDILGLTLQEAELIIAILQARQILERSDTPTPRLRSSNTG